ncbi:MAG: Exodeoxyribonuclease VII large subunit [uncultured Thermomicrobiales bacterium]|uniref:Exodeoxyribonuclease 7 large subunit n=1 Tax=uncultured Thermomicrobiales bacterium TaxID=1645740 RepID=A0A6J4V6R1_9BACT|nr:MAG: Exodeoxyribonuclease VII large subunit [uncultured Thermomicrobiales bacterium]
MTAQPQPLSVGQLADYLHDVLALDPLLSDVWVTGEVVDARQPKSGHVYFSLVDAEASLKCVLFRGQLLRQAHLPRNGLQITLHGAFDLYARSGEVQVIVDSVQPTGLGLAALEFERLRQRLEAEGIFDPARKRPLPPAPRFVGVVTSASGAVWHDIQHVVRRRYPLTHLILAPAKVQGDGAPESIVAALDALQADGRSEVVIVARGGGSAEDLAAFNAEAVVRAVFACRIPVVTGVGHETDITLIDLAADLRAPTPSAAAEQCVPSLAEIEERIVQAKERLDLAGGGALEREGARVDHLAARLDRLHPSQMLADRRHAIQDARTTMAWHVRVVRDEWRARLGAGRDLLRVLDPDSALGRGYALLADPLSGRPIARAADARAGQSFVATLADGAVDGRIERVAFAEVGAAR